MTENVENNTVEDKSFLTKLFANLFLPSILFALIFIADFNCALGLGSGSGSASCLSYIVFLFGIVIVFSVAFAHAFVWWVLEKILKRRNLSNVLSLLLLFVVAICFLRSMWIICLGVAVILLASSMFLSKIVTEMRKQKLCTGLLLILAVLFPCSALIVLLNPGPQASLIIFNIIPLLYLIIFLTYAIKAIQAKKA